MYVIGNIRLHTDTVTPKWRHILCRDIIAVNQCNRFLPIQLALWKCYKKVINVEPMENEIKTQTESHVINHNLHFKQKNDGFFLSAIIPYEHLIRVTSTFNLIQDDHFFP